MEKLEPWESVMGENGREGEVVWRRSGHGDGRFPESRITVFVTAGMAGKRGQHS